MIFYLKIRVLADQHIRYFPYMWPIVLLKVVAM